MLAETPHVMSIAFNSAVIVYHQVVLDRPCFLFPDGVHLSATNRIISFPVLLTGTDRRCDKNADPVSPKEHGTETWNKELIS